MSKPFLDNSAKT